MRAKLGTDRPIYIQYVDWVWHMLQLDFGNSYHYHTPISKDLKEKFAVTLELTFLAVLMASVVTVPLGVISAIKQDSFLEYVSRIITFSGIALPTFWVGILIIYFLVLIFEWPPPLGYAMLWEDPGKNVQRLLFPSLALAYINVAFAARLTRSSMLEVMREDYIRTARSKGLWEFTVISRHALKNACLPVVTIVGFQLGRLMGGAVLVEAIFLVPGMGSLLVDGVVQRDYRIVSYSGITL